MLRINTLAIVAMMADEQTFGNRAAMQFIGKAMRQHCSSTGNSKLTIAAAKSGASPFPAFSSAALVYFFQKAILDSPLVEIVTNDKRNRLSFDISKPGIALPGERGWLSTSTHTQPAWVRAIGIVTLAVIVAVNVLEGLSFYAPLMGIVILCNPGFLPTTTMAVTVRNFVFGHKNTSCRMTEHALAEGADRRQEARNNYSFAWLFRQLSITLSTYKYSTFWPIGKVIS